MTADYPDTVAAESAQPPFRFTDKATVQAHALLRQHLDTAGEDQESGEKGETPSGRPSKLGMRLYIDGKGCDGFYYGVSIDTEKPGDSTWLQSDITLMIDAETIPYIAGSLIDWVDDERGRGFLVDNPKHKKFKGKFFRRKNWQESVQT